ncbi:MAG: M14 family metallopeptidase [Candidatus Sericytochromatia bacterium]|nr:M14 family metallopeptidase [Candidatus Sericytochromatia bacterium]
MRPKSFARLAATLGTLAVLAGCYFQGGTGTALGGRGVQVLEKAFATGSREAIVSYRYQSAADLTRMVDSGMDVWGVDSNRKVAYGRVTRDQLNALRQRPDAVQIETGPQIYNDFDEGYHTYSTMLEDLRNLAASRPDICDLVDLGPTWETTAGKAQRRIWALHIHRGDASSRPGVIYLGNHHAREIVTPEISLNIAHMIVDQEGKDPAMTAAVQDLDIWVVPMVNPDGHALAAQGHDWRKNTNLGNLLLDLGPTGPGVDLNRNYAHHWGEGGASTNPQAPTFRGSGPGSEPETQAVMKLVSSRPFSFLMTYHSYSNLILWPWGYSDQPPPSTELVAIGQKLGQLSGYKPQQSKDLYRTSGDLTDWSYGARGILSYTTEIGSFRDGFDPPYREVARFWRENEPGARLLLQLADRPSAIAGPEVRMEDGVVSAPGARRIEVFIGRKGQPGTGMAIAQGVRPSFRGPRQLVYLHAQGADGQWGPATAAWSD